MTHEELKPVLEAAGFVLVPGRTKEGEYTTWYSGKIAVCHYQAGNCASVWYRTGDILLPFTADLEKVKKAIEEK